MTPETMTSPFRLSGKPALPDDCTATGIGSLPHRDPQAAVRLLLKIFPEIPFWPQLPCRSSEERMTKQFGLSVLRPENAAGFFELIKTLGHQPPAQLRAIKGQVTGPTTWLVSNYSTSGEILLDDISKNL